MQTNAGEWKKTSFQSIEACFLRKYKCGTTVCDIRSYTMLRHLNKGHQHHHAIAYTLLRSSASVRLSPLVLSSNGQHCHQNGQSTINNRSTFHNQVRCFSINQLASDWNSFLTNSPAVISCQEALVQLHNCTGLPWYAQIIACGVFLRTALLPLTVYERKQQAKYENLEPVLQKHAADKMEQLRLLVAKREIPSDEASIRLRREIYIKRKELIIQHNVHPFKRIIVVLFQLPIWIMMSCALGNLCLRSPFIEDHRIIQLGQTVGPQLQSEGTLWFQDLTRNDPTMLLPVLFGTLFLANVLVSFNYPK